MVTHIIEPLRNASLHHTAFIMLPTPITTMPHICSMLFPEYLSIAGVILSNGRSEGITNHAFLKTLVDELVEKSGFRGWEAGDPVHVTRKALKRKKEEYDGEGPVEILGEEWKANNNGRWATPGCV